MNRVILLSLTLLFVACAKDEKGNVVLSPNARDLMLSVAQAEAHTLANSYLTTGNVDFKRDLISGALSQVYTLEGTATPVVQATVKDAVDNVIKDPGMQSAVTNAVINTINAAPQGTTKTTAINNGIALLDQLVASLSSGAP